ncbi:MAG: hypothetical protein GOV15_01390 [Candidatus Diapherotrites archaeon]|nr:hypothetical protein [Candidatus Diapherotrites archaeon]
MVKERFSDLKDSADMIVTRIQNTPYGDSLPIVASDLERSLMILSEMNARLDMLSEITEIQGEVIHQLVRAQSGTTRRPTTKKKTAKRKATKKKAVKKKAPARRKATKKKAPARKKTAKRKPAKRKR